MITLNSPRLYLAMDNCFAIKRWITPSQWMPLIRDLGATSIEASTDNEMDPLFSPASYMDDWVDEVERCEQEYGMKVRSFFTGYQTYRTTGLAHPDPRMRKKLKDEWFKTLIKYAGRLNADIGFSFHALQEETLQDPKKFAEASALVVDEYAELAAFAWDNGKVSLCCEQMYAPYQTPWTIDGTESFLRDVYAKGGRPFYTAVDVGDMVGQAKYRKPTTD
ncbi:MAG: sugar phosphate isomerase/epimerase, partial [Planctomycetaceae bacterium]|nr:sugar phosphate isomerase/epimerase [Planctomycetaceae bacterium]